MTEPRDEKDPAKVGEMFDGIAQRYDITNDVLSFGLTRHWRHVVTGEIAPRPGLRILDLAAGTGTSSVPLYRAGASVVAADFSEGMVAEGIRRHPELDFVRADAMDLPFEDESFDVVTMSFGLRNVADPAKALGELHRVTRPGGRIVLCEFSQPPNPLLNSGYGFYRSRVLPLVAGAVTGKTDSYTYLSDTIESWPNQVDLGRMLLRAGWQKVAYRNLAGGIVAVHRGQRDVADGLSHA
ncbi:demethylmenaquinone methyltransferase [Rarobacter faecitabidus]|uniref:Demethylmenaquinone methyltransferase n=1 Tax=Rarobacter faecitabidus TaxID=13243 RepID=A0A542ZTW0_RARFA|nr:class I SAM-dependent methyltransferase [Rarobacter faecitabidus]TQL63757.1 demethylmenaquinone methyltransferase/2-methoxy-6-polyprenyl-1,4-benzoquinol methylase [Rarobacter faecitabidus]